MDIQSLIDYIKFSSHYVREDIISINDVYFIKDKNIIKEIGQEKVRVIKKYKIKNDSALVRSKIIKIFEGKFGKNKQNFVKKEKRIKKKKVDKIIWDVFDDVTKSSRYSEDVFPNLPESLRGIYIEMDTYVIVMDGKKKLRILQWLNEE